MADETILSTRYTEVEGRRYMTRTVAWNGTTFQRFYRVRANGTLGAQLAPTCRAACRVVRQRLIEDGVLKIDRA